MVELDLLNVLSSFAFGVSLIKYSAKRSFVPHLVQGYTSFNLEKEYLRGQWNSVRIFEMM